MSFDSIYTSLDPQYADSLPVRYNELGLIYSNADVTFFDTVNYIEPVSTPSMDCLTAFTVFLQAHDEPQNVCSDAGNTNDPSWFALRGWLVSSLGSAPGVIYDASKGFPRGQMLDAQAQGGSRAYGNYAYGAYMSAAGMPLDIALYAANKYAGKHATYPSNLLKSHDFPATPESNVRNIVKGFVDYQDNALCQK